MSSSIPKHQTLVPCAWPILRCIMVQLTGLSLKKNLNFTLVAETEFRISIPNFFNHSSCNTFNNLEGFLIMMAYMANLCISDLDLRQKKIFVRNGKGRKDRVVYISRDTYEAIVNYLRVRRSSKAKRLFLVEKGLHLCEPISVRGIQKRIEHYSRISGIEVSCHQLRHTMATQMLNADAVVETIQDLLGHNAINTTERYCSISNLKVMRDYFKAMEVIMQRSTRGHP
jgi:Phage integrase family